MPIRCRSLALALLAFAASGCSPAGPGAGAAPRPVQVAVTVPPQAYLVERIGGERVATEVLMPSGSSEETFSPSPRQLVALFRADLYVLVGHPAFAVEERHVLPALARNPGVQVVSMWEGEGEGEGVRPAPSSAAPVGSESSGWGKRSGTLTRSQQRFREGASPSPRHDNSDPHLWTAPRHMRSAAVLVASALSELDPPGASTYRMRLASFLGEIDALDAEICRELSGLPRRRFLVTHPAWGHFAAQYGLEQMAIEEEGKEPGPRRLVALVEEARAEGIRAVFSQAGFPDAAARAVAAEIGARLVPLDPLARSWLDNTRHTARAIAASLEASKPAGRSQPPRM